MNIRWLGTEESWEQYQTIIAMGMARLDANPKLLDDRDEDEGRSPMNPKLIGNVLVGNVHGPIVSKSNWLTRYFGLVSYDDIQGFLKGPASAEDVKYALLHYDTGGGAAKGCDGCAHFIRDFSKSQKPVISYVETAGSAGLYNAVAGAQVVIGKEGEMGSVGALFVHSEMSQMRKQEGITDTIIRSSPKKALVNSLEPLTDVAKEQLNAVLDRLHTQFVSSVAEFRGLEVEGVQERIATGEMFFADKARKLKLADHVLSFPELLAKLASARKPPK